MDLGTVKLASETNSEKFVSDPVWWFAGLALAVVGLYWPSVASLWQRWQPDPSYSHGVLVVAVSAWLVWREARAGRLSGATPSYAALAALPLLGFAWLLAMAGSVAIVQWLLLPALLFAVAWALFGRRAFSRLWFPIGFMLFAIPVWDWLKPLLQDITTWVVGVALMLLRVPAHLDGYRVMLPAGSFEIVEGCSGMHYFLVSLTLGCLYGWLWYQRLAPTLKLLCVALGVAVIANWIRVFAVIYAGYLSDMQHFLVQVDHYYFGWVMYLLLSAPVLWYARSLETAIATAPSTPAASDASDVPHNDRRWLAVTGWALAALLLAPLGWWLLSSVETRPAPAHLPDGAGDWTRLGPARPDWRPAFRGADATLDAGYWLDQQGVDAWVVYYARPQQGAELVSQGNRLAARRDGRLTVRDGEALLSGPGGERLIHYRYLVGGRETTRPLVAKIYQIVATLSGRPEAALIAYSAFCGSDCESEQALLEAFDAALGDELRAAILR